jgi:hypothetical protein
VQNGGLKTQKCTKISKYCAKSHISGEKNSQKLQKGEFL